MLKFLILTILTFIFISSKKLKAQMKKDIVNDTKEIIENVTSYLTDTILSPLAKELHHTEHPKKEKRKYSKKNLLNIIIPHNSTKNNTNYRKEPNHKIEVSPIEKDVKNFIADNNDSYIQAIYNESETLNEVYNTINWTVIYDNMKEIEPQNTENETLINQLTEEVKDETNKNNEKEQFVVQEPESVIQQEEIVQEPTHVIDDNGSRNPIIEPPKDNYNVNDDNDITSNDKEQQQFEVEQFVVDDVAEDNYRPEEPEENLNDGIPEEKDEKRDYHIIQPQYPQQPEDYPQQPQEPENYPQHPQQTEDISQQPQESEEPQSLEDIQQEPQEPEEYPQQPEEVSPEKEQEIYEIPQQPEDVKQELENHTQKEVEQKTYKDTIKDIIDEVSIQLEKMFENEEKEEQKTEESEESKIEIPESIREIPELMEEKKKEQPVELIPQELKEQEEKTESDIEEFDALPKSPVEKEEMINEEEKKIIPKEFEEKNEEGFDEKMEEIQEKVNDLKEQEFEVSQQPQDINDDNKKYQVQQLQSQIPQQPQDVEQSQQKDNIIQGIKVNIPPIPKDEKKEEKKECKCHDVSDIKETVEKLLENLQTIKNSVLEDKERIKGIVSDYKINNSEQDYLDNINLKLTGDYSSETDDINDELMNILETLNNECKTENETNGIKSFIEKKYSKIINDLF